ncbi:MULTISPECIES: BolA family protein [Candidatus Ichthyocystis]|uniref:Transcriptional regulator, BolA family n=1 Tax=Candidatus Ichthyocystis hellenicum TaxID=1561003 RepID=A0A0S4M092_9BURK|nr:MULTISPECIES: BolA/IbaG family iron-sulfur metabolism protein [Ichthyocystis]CUT17025.1 transcriptional regulator, BolA family [Candidatus Ichthyocystis hellenicum]
MTPEDVRSCIMQVLEDEDSFVTVDGADGRHFSAVVVSKRFDGLTLLRRHRLVMVGLGDRIAADVIHALSLRTFTPLEWERSAK